MNQSLDVDRYLDQREHEYQMSREEPKECPACDGPLNPEKTEWSEYHNDNVCPACWSHGLWLRQIKNNLDLLVKMANGTQNQESVTAKDVEETIMRMIEEASA